MLFYCLKLDAMLKPHILCLQSKQQIHSFTCRAELQRSRQHDTQQRAHVSQGGRQQREGSAQSAGVVTETLHTEETRWLDVIQQLVHSQCEGCIELWSRDISTTWLEYSGINPPTLQQPAPPPEPQPPKTPKDHHYLTMPTWGDPNWRW